MGRKREVKEKKRSRNPCREIERGNHEEKDGFCQERRGKVGVLSLAYALHELLVVQRTKRGQRVERSRPEYGTVNEEKDSDGRETEERTGKSETHGPTRKEEGKWVLGGARAARAAHGTEKKMQTR